MQTQTWPTTPDADTRRDSGTISGPSVDARSSRTALISAVSAAGHLVFASCSGATPQSTTVVQTRCRIANSERSSLRTRPGAWHQRDYGPPAGKSQGIAPSAPRAIHAVTFFYTAEVYGPYTSETLVGEALAPIRDQVAIASKFGFDIAGSGGPLSQPDHIKKVVEESLTRLRTDRIDLYYQHRVDPNVPIDVVAGAIKEFVDVARCCTSVSPKPVHRRSAVPTLCYPSLRYRPNTRYGNANPNATPSSTPARSVFALVPLVHSGQGYLTGKIDSSTRFDPNTDVRSIFPRLRHRRTCKQTSPSSTSSPVGPTRRMPPPPRSRWPGCWPRRLFHRSRSPAPATSSTSKKTSARSPSICHLPKCNGSAPNPPP